MFNTFDEHLFACQSLLKEQMPPPTGGVRRALKESLGEGLPRPHPLLWGRKQPLEPLKLGSPFLRKMTGYCFVRNCPIGAFPVRVSFLVRTTKGFVLIGFKTLRVF